MGAMQDGSDLPTTKEAKQETTSPFDFSKFGDMAKKVSGRLQKVTTEDITSIVGIDSKFTQREVKFLQSIFSGEGLSHHMEDRYYQGMGMCCGYAAMVGQELKPLDELEEELSGLELKEVEEAINMNTGSI